MLSKTFKIRREILLGFAGNIHGIRILTKCKPVCKYKECSAMCIRYSCKKSCAIDRVNWTKGQNSVSALTHTRCWENMDHQVLHKLGVHRVHLRMVYTYGIYNHRVLHSTETCFYS